MTGTMVMGNCVVKVVWLLSVIGYVTSSVTPLLPIDDREHHNNVEPSHKMSYKIKPILTEMRTVKYKTDLNHQSSTEDTNRTMLYTNRLHSPIGSSLDIERKTSTESSYKSVNNVKKPKFTNASSRVKVYGWPYLPQDLQSINTSVRQLPTMPSDLAKAPTRLKNNNNIRDIDIMNIKSQLLQSEFDDTPHTVPGGDVMLSSNDDRHFSDEERLLDFLLSSYNPSARPVFRANDTVNVAMQFALMRIKDLDIKSQVLTSTGLLILEWTDERLVWEPEEHNDIEEIVVEIKFLWQPEFAVINRLVMDVAQYILCFVASADTIYNTYDHFRAVVHHDGLVHWEPGGVFKTMCEVDITYYPFDEQKCKLVFGAWTYHTGKMNLTTIGHEINRDSYRINGEWTITSTLAQRDEFAYAQSPKEPFSFINFVLFLRRRSTFYVINVILPTVMISVLLLAVFFAPAAHKVKIGTVVLLSYRIFLVNVAKDVPNTSDHIPLLGIYLSSTMAITTLSLILTVLVLNIMNNKEKAIPGWATSVLFVSSARFMGMNTAANALVKLKCNTGLRKKNNFKNILCGIEVQSVIMEPGQGLEMLNISDGSFPELNKDEQHDDHNTGSTYTVDAEKEDFSKDWQKLAEICDRLFFWIFLMGVVISTCILFSPMMLTDNADT